MGLLQETSSSSDCQDAPMSSIHSSLSSSLSRGVSSRVRSHPCSALHERISEVCGHHAWHDPVDSYTLGAHLCRQGPSEPKEGGLAHSVEPEGRSGPERGRLGVSWGARIRHCIAKTSAVTHLLCQVTHLRVAALEGDPSGESLWVHSADGHEVT